MSLSLSLLGVVLPSPSMPNLGSSSLAISMGFSHILMDFQFSVWPSLQILVLCWVGTASGPFSRDRKDHDSQRRDRILRFSPPGNRAIFSTFWGDFLTKSNSTPGEKGKNPLEKIQKIQWRRHPETAHFCPLSWSNASGFPANPLKWVNNGLLSMDSKWVELEVKELGHSDLDSFTRTKVQKWISLCF